MSKFNRGDVVLVNGSQVATVHTYDEESGRLVLSQENGGSEHLIYGPIVSYRLQHLVSPAIGADPEPDSENADVSPAAESEDSPKDEFTTLGSL